MKHKREMVCGICGNTISEREKIKTCVMCDELICSKCIGDSLDVSPNYSNISGLICKRCSDPLNGDSVVM